MGMGEGKEKKGTNRAMRRKRSGPNLPWILEAFLWYKKRNGLVLKSKHCRKRVVVRVGLVGYGRNESQWTGQYSGKIGGPLEFSFIEVSGPGDFST